MSGDKPEFLRCTAHTSSGRPCGQRPIRGGTVCATHGGSAPQVRAKANARLAQMDLARQVSVWGGRVDITPPEALLELVQRKAFEVGYWDDLVAGLPEDQRAGMLVSKSEQGVGPMGPVDTETKQAGPHVFVVMLHRAQDQLAAYSAKAVQAGVDVEVVKMAAIQSVAVIELVRAAIDAARRDLCAPADDLLLSLLVHHQAVTR